MPVAIIAVLLAGVLFLWPKTSGLPSPTKTVTESVSPASQISSVDDVEATLLKNSTDESKLLDESSSVDQMSSDSAALESAGNSYDENTL